VRERSYDMTLTNATGVKCEAETRFDEAYLNIEIRDVNGKDIESATIGETIRIYIGTNLPDDDVVKIKMEDPDGYVTNLDIVEINDAKSYDIDTADWDTDEYKLWLKTVKEEAMGLDMESDEDEIEMFEAEIIIEVDEEEPMKYEYVEFTVTTPPNTEFNFTTTEPEYVMMTDREGNPLNLTVSDESMSECDGKFTAATDEDGRYEFVMYFTEDRSFTSKVWYDATTYTDADKRDKVCIDVQEAEVEFDMPGTAVIGEEVAIKGTVNGGRYVVITIDDIVEFRIAGLINGKFEEEWDTSNEIEGSVTIDVFIEPRDDDGDEIYPNLTEGETDMKSECPGIDPDGSTSIILIEPEITIEQPRDSIAKGDSYTIKGNATGVDAVDTIIVGPDGYVTVGLCVENGLYITPGSVFEDKFEEEIDIPKDTDIGRYTAIVITTGKDGVYGKSDTDDLLDLFEAEYGGEDLPDLEGNGADQIIDTLMIVTVKAAGSDDLYDDVNFAVDEPYIKLDRIRSVKVDEDLIINGTTNREDGTLITVTTIKGPTDLTGSSEVEDGRFTVTIDTSDAERGRYKLKAEDPDGNMDEGRGIIRGSGRTG
jgi:hypothetical protein